MVGVGLPLISMMLGAVCLEFCERWYLVVTELHRFFIAVPRAVVNDDSAACIAPHPLVWSAAGPLEKRRVVQAIRDAALLPGPPPTWDSGWVGVPLPQLLRKMSVSARILLEFWSCL